MHRPRIYVEGEPMTLNADGVAHYQVKTTEVGEQQIEGFIYWKKGKDNYDYLPFVQKIHCSAKMQLKNTSYVSHLFPSKNQ